METEGMNSAIKSFYNLAMKAELVLKKTFDCREAEPIYIEVLTLIKQHPQKRTQFVKALLSLLKSRKGPWELIQFCMRELQWPEVKEELLSRLSIDTDPREISVIGDILAVYEPIWEDSDLYKYYSE